MLALCQSPDKRGRSVEKVITDPAALLQVKCTFLQRVKNAINRISDGAHDKAIKQGDLVRSAGPGLDAAARQKLEVLQDVVKTRLPNFFIAVRRSQRVCDTSPSVGDGSVVDLSAFAIAVFDTPNMPGNRYSKMRINHNVQRSLNLPILQSLHARIFLAMHLFNQLLKSILDAEFCIMRLQFSIVAAET